jgi:hypothetical protein
VHDEAVVEARGQLQRRRSRHGLALALLACRCGGRCGRGGCTQRRLVRRIGQDAQLVAAEADRLQLGPRVDDGAVSGFLVVPDGLDVLAVLWRSQYILSEDSCTSTYREFNNASRCVSLELLAGGVRARPRAQDVPARGLLAVADEDVCLHVGAEERLGGGGDAGIGSRGSSSLRVGVHQPNRQTMSKSGTDLRSGKEGITGLLVLRESQARGGASNAFVVLDVESALQAGAD